LPLILDDSASFSSLIYLFKYFGSKSSKLEIVLGLKCKLSLFLYIIQFPKFFIISKVKGIFVSYTPSIDFLTI
jgi:hypothetical protein